MRPSRCAAQCAQWESGEFAEEIAPVTVRTRKGETVDKDETPFTCDIAKIPQLKPAFRKDGTGNGRLILVDLGWSRGGGAHERVQRTRQRGLRPLACASSRYASHSIEPEWLPVAPAGAIRKALDKAGWQPQQVDLWEINEAFAAVAMVAIHELGLDAARVNVNGGACALGHPVGATGARIVTTLIHCAQAPRVFRAASRRCASAAARRRRSR
ncbi:MAG: hypothetical protein U1F11_09900 [Steroidobacteraceae bacterium]